ncbi:MAG: SCP2 sterol-binding domain-containing protein [Alphaproteobacteria bacterium]|nr:SCP2 sterol-binding domain-containing protein [Alphaproteobacteria bacterium]MBF0250285.1 SCP2 sterol-binding domain-containing protein [Alphaproteobacteria bacterium]
MFSPPSSSSGPRPPLSPILIGGLVARPLPPSLLQPALSAAMATVNRRHPGLFERLSNLDTPVFLIDPVDLGLVFVLHADAERPTLTARRTGEGCGAVATIRGPLLKLLELLEGRTDGDALFFSRDLVIEGDTGAVVALRNAVDGTEIDLLNEVAGAFGPLAGPVRGVARFGQRIFARMAEDMEILHGALVSTTQRRVEAQGVKLRDLDAKVAELGKSARRQRTPKS